GLGKKVVSPTINNMNTFQAPTGQFSKFAHQWIVGNKLLPRFLPQVGISNCDGEDRVTIDEQTSLARMLEQPRHLRLADLQFFRHDFLFVALAVEVSRGNCLQVEFTEVAVHGNPRLKRGQSSGRST